MKKHLLIYSLVFIHLHLSVAQEFDLMFKGHKMTKKAGGKIMLHGLKRYSKWPWCLAQCGSPGYQSCIGINSCQSVFTLVSGGERFREELMQSSKCDYWQLQPGCRKTWKHYFGSGKNFSCYIIKDGSRFSMPWVEAATWCREKNGHLVSVETKEEQRHLAKILQYRVRPDAPMLENIYWTGSYMTMNVWYWLPRTKFSYSNWVSEDANKPTFLGYVAIMASENFKWKPFEPLTKFGFICEKESSPAGPVLI